MPTPTPKKPAPRKVKPITLDNPPADENDAPLSGVRLPHTPRFQFGVFDEGDEAERDEMRRIAEIIDAEGAGGGKIRVERRKATEADYSYLDEIPTENFSIDLVQKAYGGGDFKCRVFRSDGKFFKGFRFRIDHTIPAKHPLAGNGGGDHSQDIAAIIRELKDSKSPGLDMGAFLQQQNSTTAMMMMMMSKQQESQTQLVAAMLGAMGNKGGGNDELLKILLSERKEKPINELVETMLALRELDSGKGGNEKQGFFERLAEAAAPALGQVLAAGASASHAPAALPAPAPTPPLVASPLPSPTAPAAGIPHPGTLPNPPVSANPEQNMIRILFAQYREPLMRAGLAGQDAKEFAAQVAGFVPPNLSQAVLDALSAESWFSDLFAADPRAVQIRPWLTTLRDTLIDLIAEPEETGNGE